MNSTLDRGLGILEHLAANPRDFSVSALAEDLGMGKSMVHRLLATLVARGYVRRDPATRRYAASLGAVELSSRILGTMPLRSRSAPYLRRLAEELGLTSYLGVPHLGRNLIVHVSYPRGVVRPDVAIVGGSGPLHPTAIGKVLMAYREDVRAAGLEGKARLERVTEMTITSPEALLDHLGKVRRAGYAESLGENGAGTAGVAAPVFDCEGVVVAGLGAALPLDEYLGKKGEADRVRDAVSEAATSVSFAMGYGKAHLAAR